MYTPLYNPDNKYYENYSHLCMLIFICPELMSTRESNNHPSRVAGQFSTKHQKTLRIKVALCSKFTPIFQSNMFLHHYINDDREYQC